MNRSEGEQPGRGPRRVLAIVWLAAAVIVLVATVLWAPLVQATACPAGTSDDSCTVFWFAVSSFPAIPMLWLSVVAATVLLAAVLTWLRRARVASGTAQSTQPPSPAESAA